MTRPPSDALGWLAAAAAEREAAGLHRDLDVRSADDQLLDLAGNDYLGLSRHPEVVAAGEAALRRYGAGATGSRLVSGSTELHEQLERALAALFRAPAALVFSSGYTANLAAVTALTGPGSLVVSATGNHASLVDACRLARARVVVVPDDDVDAVRRVLAERSEARALVVTDAVFSVTGRLARVAELADVARAAGAALVVDEAHAVGVVGRTGEGVCAASDVLGPDVVRTATLSKALGGQGGVVAGSAALRAHLVDTARSFIFDTGLAPASAATALAAVGLLTPERVRRLHEVATGLAARLDLPAPPAAVVPLTIGDPHRAAAARDACRAAGVRVGCFRPPSVPPGASCLRLTARADLSDVDLDRAAAVVLSATRVPV